MKLTIFGSTGVCGRAVLTGALARGHEVTALVRSADRLPRAAAGIRVVVGDALDRASIRAALQNSDAVIQCLGVGGLGDGRPNDLVPDATALIVKEMSVQQIRRIVCAGNVGVPGSGAFLLSRVIAPLFVRKLLPIIEAKIKMEAILRECDLDWTVVRLPALNNKPSRKSRRVSVEGRAMGLGITTSDAADFMLDIIERREFAGKAVAISN